ncbi:hypothetical protein [Flavobacterium soyangense]|uniref:Lipoprotein n=1 Tax=Flavobacterium soyangense TaxID=2023265 RepID=A0A930U7C3_9FLAO|nr:hypothetical protein [Flavobacterium soyangense]MBF2708263.1 hypothetical protein [Flavobacterium soyangense]
MKKTILVLCILLLIGCKSKSVVIKPVEKKCVKLSISEVDESQKKKAYDLGKRVLMICNTSKFIPFNKSEATPSVIANTTLEKHSATCLKFRARYGSFKDLKLVEIHKNITENTTIFRYKALYEHENANKELRVTLSQENKVSSLKTMEWADVFKCKF